MIDVSALLDEKKERTVIINRAQYWKLVRDELKRRCGWNGRPDYVRGWITGMVQIPKDLKDYIGPARESVDEALKQAGIEVKSIAGSRLP